MYASRTSGIAVFTLCAVFLAPLGARTARAAIIATQSVTGQQSTRSADLARIQRQLDNERVSQLLQQKGVSRADVNERLAGLTDSEVTQLADKLDKAPAGGDFFALVGVVFVVLLILELCGVIDIFKSIGPARR
ncbi:MAG: PA2779 family protein [Steroidobacteraceae bacterium]